MVFALDPRIHRVWRTPHVLQFGVDRPVLTLDDVTIAEERMLVALAAGTTLPGLRLAAGKGTDAATVERFLERVAVVLSPGRPATRRELVIVDGAGPVSALLLSILREEGMDVRNGLAWDDPAVPLADAAVIVAGFAVPPDRHRRWLQHDVPHLPVVFGDDEVQVGPFVRPGLGPCLTCADLQRTDDDPQWPALATQLFDRPPQRESVLITALASAAAALALVDALRNGPSHDAKGSAPSVSVDYRTGQRRERWWRRHPACGCGGLSG